MKGTLVHWLTSRHVWRPAAVLAQRALYSVVALPCTWTVRAWYYPATGKDRTPRMLPAQYWPNEFAASTEDGALPYATSFAKGIKATAPLESDDRYAPK